MFRGRISVNNQMHKKKLVDLHKILINFLDTRYQDFPKKNTNKK